MTFVVVRAGGNIGICVLFRGSDETWFELFIDKSVDCMKDGCDTSIGVPLIGVGIV